MKKETNFQANHSQHQVYRSFLVQRRDFKYIECFDRKKKSQSCVCTLVLLDLFVFELMTYQCAAN